MNSRKCKEEYLRWLYFQVDGFNPFNGTMYLTLLNRLYNRDFYVVVDMDENRRIDGFNLRELFESDDCPMMGEGSLNDEVSVLEVLVALAMSFRELNNDKEPVAFYFWEMIGNLGLLNCTDLDWVEGVEEYVDNIIDTFLDRDYEANGDGGLFPLLDPQEDQTEVELWYQLSAYYMENYYEYDSEV